MPKAENPYYSPSRIIETQGVVTSTGSPPQLGPLKPTPPAIRNAIVDAVAASSLSRCPRWRRRLIEHLKETAKVVLGGVLIHQD